MPTIAAAATTKTTATTTTTLLHSFATVVCQSIFPVLCHVKRSISLFASPARFKYLWRSEQGYTFVCIRTWLMLFDIAKQINWTKKTVIRKLCSWMRYASVCAAPIIDLILGRRMSLLCWEFKCFLLQWKWLKVAFCKLGHKILSFFEVLSSSNFWIWFFFLLQTTTKITNFSFLVYQ